MIEWWLMDFEKFEPMFNANMVTATSYFVIAILLFVALYVFWNFFGWLIRGFLIQFICSFLICGVAHIIKVYNFWWGDFGLELRIDVLTAIISSATALTGLIAFAYTIFRYTKNKELFKKNNTDFYSIIGLMQVIYKKEKKTNKRNGKTSNIQ